MHRFPEALPPIIIAFIPKQAICLLVHVCLPLFVCRREGRLVAQRCLAKSYHAGQVDDAQAIACALPRLSFVPQWACSLADLHAGGTGGGGYPLTSNTSLVARYQPCHARTEYPSVNSLVVFAHIRFQQRTTCIHILDIEYNQQLTTTLGPAMPHPATRNHLPGYSFRRCYTCTC